MPGLTVVSYNTMLAAFAGKPTPSHTIQQLSLHNNSPGTTGANEVSGGGYAKANVTPSSFVDPTVAELVLAADIEFDGTPGATANHLGLWDGATFLGGRALTGASVFNSEGKYVVKAGTKIVLTTVTP